MQLGAAKPSDRAKLSTVRLCAHPIDLVHLSRYTLGDRALEREALELFCSQSVLYLDRLRKAETERAWREGAHSLKGCSRAIGAWRVAAAAEAAEAIPAERLHAERKGCIAKLQAALNEAVAYVQALQPEG